MRVILRNTQTKIDLTDDELDVLLSSKIESHMHLSGSIIESLHHKGLIDAWVINGLPVYPLNETGRLVVKEIVEQESEPPPE